MPRQDYSGGGGLMLIIGLPALVVSGFFGWGLYEFFHWVF